MKKDSRRYYWLEFRQKFTANPWLENGLLLSTSNRADGSCDPARNADSASADCHGASASGLRIPGKFGKRPIFPEPEEMIPTHLKQKLCGIRVHPAVGFSPPIPQREVARSAQGMSMAEYPIL